MADLDEIFVFSCVARSMSFSAAARELGLTVSSVSKHVARLERALDTPLLTRSTHHRSLTPAGRRLYEGCAHALLEISNVKDSVRRSSTEPTSDTLRVHITPGVGQRLIEPVLVDYLRERPGLNLDMQMSPELVNPLERGLDLVIRTGSDEDPLMRHNSLSHKKICSLTYLICASESYFAKRPEPREPRDLSVHDCLIHSTQSSPTVWWFRGDSEPYSVTVSGPLVSDSHSLIAQAAMAGVGIGRFLTLGGLQSHKLSGMRELFPGLSSRERSMRAYFPRRDAGSSKSEDVIAFLESNLPLSRPSPFA